MYNSIQEVERDIETLRKRIEELEKEKKAIESWTPDERLAEELHSKQCHWNHTDGCGWFYSTWEKPGTERIAYREKARLLQRIIADEVKIQKVGTTRTEEDILRRIINSL